ncbi:hypothetical protein FOZ60_005851 [Perkinsus olseni]|uniref:Uncharacterized protein n=1 Tax=Perkinsus olseni TaxID=32597 RepID=A0A7J6PFY0_PEROL|nr:hypothetical protein FOZ60_005851 [Perkinsus olseni]
MRSFVVSLSTFATALSLVSATEDPCSQMCSDVSGCANSKYGSYCKSWETPAVCFGLIKKSDGSICFEPTDPGCAGEPLACGVQTTMAPATTTKHTSTAFMSTTKAPMTTSTGAETTTTGAETTTTGAETTTTGAETTTTGAETTTTGAETTTTGAETTTTGAATSTTGAETTTGVPTVTTTVPVSTTTTVEVTTTESTTSAATTTTQAAGLNGKYCGNLYGQDFSVDFESGRATLSVLGQTAGCDYEVDGTDIEFSNYDAILQKLMNMFHINKIQGTIVSPTEIHIKAGNLIDTTLTQC